MEISLTINDVSLDETQWDNNLVHPRVKSDVSDLKISWGSSKCTVCDDDLELTIYNKFTFDGDGFFDFAQHILTQFNKEIYGTKLILTICFTENDIVYALNIVDAYYLIEINYADKKHSIFTEYSDINKIRRLFITSVLMKENYRGIDHDIIYNHFITEEYKNIVYTPDVLRLINQTINDDHEKCLAYIVDLLKNISIDLDKASYTITN